MKTNVFIQTQNFWGNPRGTPFTANWNLKRSLKFQYKTDKEGEAAAEETFHLTNAPKEILSEEEKIKGFSGPALSVGDIVSVQTNREITGYLCCGNG